MYASPCASPYLSVALSAWCHVWSFQLRRATRGFGFSPLSFCSDPPYPLVPWSAPSFSRLIVTCLSLGLLLLDHRNVISFLPPSTGTSVVITDSNSKSLQIPFHLLVTYEASMEELQSMFLLLRNSSIIRVVCFGSFVFHKHSPIYSIIVSFPPEKTHP
jgi:hypothetical protein